MKWSDAYQHSGWTITVPVKLVHAIGAKGAILISQLFYWKGKQQDPDGWIYKTKFELEQETGLARWEQDTCTGDLKKKRILETKYDRLDHRLYYRIDTETLDAIMEADFPSEIGNHAFGKPGNTLSPNHESSCRENGNHAFGINDQEITSENTKTTQRSIPKDTATPQPEVVVASLVAEFKLNQIQRKKIARYIKERGPRYVQEKASLTRSEKRENAGRYFMGALRDDFQLPKPSKPDQTAKTIQRSEIDWDWKTFLVHSGMPPDTVPKSLEDMSDRMFKQYITPEHRKRLGMPVRNPA